MHAASLGTFGADSADGGPGILGSGHDAESDQIITGGNAGKKSNSGQEDRESSAATVTEARPPVALRARQHAERYEHS